MAHYQKLDGKRGVRWRVYVKSAGKTHSKTFKLKADAQAWAKELERDISTGALHQPSQRRVEEAIDRYLTDVLPHKAASTRKHQKAQLTWWREAIGGMKLTDVTPALIAEARDRLARKRSAGTVNRYLAILSHLFSKCAGEWQWIVHHPMRGTVERLKEPPGRVRFLDEKEIGALLAACRESRNPALYPAVVLALSTGMRQGEILSLRWKQVDLARRLIVLPKTKNKERRGLPVTDQALGALRDIQRYTHTDLLFPSPKDAGKPTVVRGAFEAAVEKAEIEDFRFHDLRHTCASYLAMNGASEREIAEVLGHKTLAMVKRYSHLSREHLRGVLEKMNAAIFEG